MNSLMEGLPQFVDRFDQEHGQLLLNLYQIIKLQEAQIQKLQQQSKAKVNVKTRQTHTPNNYLLKNQQLDAQLKALVSKYEQSVHENQKLSIINSQQKQLISKLEHTQKELHRELEEYTLTLQSLKSAYEAKIEKVAKAVREQTISECQQKYKKIHQEQQNAKNRVINFARLNTPSKEKSNISRSKVELITQTPISKIISTTAKTTNLINSPYLNTEVRPKLFEETIDHLDYPVYNPEMHESKSDKEQITKKSSNNKIKIKELLTQLSCQMKKFDYNDV